MKSLLVLIPSYFLVLTSFGQSAAISAPTSACLQQNILLENESQQASRYEWDLCPNDLDNLFSNSQPATIAGLSSFGGYAYKLVEDGGLWYGFLAQSSISGVLYRLDFGNKPTNQPTIVTLGNPGNALVYPVGIDIYKAGGNWYGFVGMFDVNGGIVRLDFGTSLTNTPTGRNLGMFGLGGRYWDVKVVQENGNLILVMPLRGVSTSIVRVNYRDSFDNTISNVADVYASNPNVDVVLGTSLDLARIGNDWVALAVSNSNNTIVQFRFPTSILSEPNEERVYQGSELNKPFQIKILRESSRYVAVIANENSNLSIVNFFDFGLGATPARILSGSLPALLSVDVCKYKGASLIQGGGASDNLSSLVFQSNCGAPFSFTEDFEPTNLKYSSPGVKDVELRAFDIQNSFSIASTQIVVSSLTAPDINFVSQNNCVGSSVNFTSSSTSGDINTYLWKFGDGGTSTLPNPTYTFSSVGSYFPILNVTSANGCENTIEKQLQIFKQPQANFSIPAVTPFCTNQLLTFTNTTPSIGTTIGWQWSVNGNDVSTAQNLSSLFSSTGPQTINLQASIPGCSSTFSQTINSLIEGPLANFTAPSASCLQGSVSFSNTTIGSVSSYQWSFGDGNTSTSTNASNTYANIGTYQVTLQANNAAGCQNTTTKSITIYSKPQPDFAIGLPPFSCAGTPSQFTDQTPAPNDSNIAGWQWAFGDPASGTSNTRNPTYIYSTAGAYNVSLTATTNFGCSNTIQKAVTISTSPQAAFTNSVACVSQPTQFTDGSSGSIRSRLWTIQGNSFTTPNVQFAFVTPGSYPVLLTVTGTNNCTSQAVKNIVVPVLPTLDFSVQAACNTNPTLFSEITSGADAPQSQTWNFASLGTGTGAAAQFTFSTPGNYAVQLRSTRQSGCVYSVTKNVSVIQGPVADFTPSVDVGGPPLPVNFVNTSAGANSYLWRFGDAANTTSTAVNPSFTFSDLGVYAVKLTASNAAGCSFTTSKPVTVLVPNINLVLSDFRTIADASGILQPTVSIFNNGNLPVTSPDLLIDVASAGLVRKRLNARILPNQTISVPVDLQIVPRSADYICAELVVPNNTADFDKRRCLPLGSEEVLFAPYPNPAADILNFDWVSTQTRPVSVIVFSPGGSEVFRQRFESIAAGLNRLQIKTTELPSGLYYILYSDGSTTKSFSFAIAKN